MIKAPYNFVPLASKVVFPDWASQISIDRPFEDGISGTINVKYTAQTPIFIGNGKSDNNAPISNYKAANGKYAIPGSSLRGMFRNVIEIASFGKFSRVSDAALSVRDLQNRNLYTNHLTRDRGSRTYESMSKAGWLVFDNNAWMLYPVRFHRVEDSLLEKKYHLDANVLKRRTPLDKRNRLINGNTSVYFSTEERVEHEHHGGMKLVYSKVDVLKDSSFSGASHGFVVLTGQPGRVFSRKQNREIGKHLDFVFEDKGSNKINVDDEIILQFKQANAPKASDQKKGLNLPKKLRESQKNGYPGIPVFYLPNADGKPDSLGLSLMYRLPYKNSLHEAVKNSSKTHFSDNMDFAECVFGKISNQRNMSLRGRVQFEDATTDSVSLARQVDTILGNPKPSYYPNYIRQVSKDTDYKTLMDNDVILRGWKRYPVKDETNPMPIGEDQDNVSSHFSPLQKGTIFSGKIHFHNLKKEELGALLWAITWGNDNALSHAVGMGKPYGFGQLKACISSTEYLNNNSDGNDYKVASETENLSWIKAFESFMEDKIEGWKNSSQLKELKAMANPKNAMRNGWDLSHMSLSGGGDNEFVSAKKEKRFLAPYSSANQEMQLISTQGNRQRNFNNFGHGNFHARGGTPRGWNN